VRPRSAPPGVRTMTALGRAWVMVAAVASLLAASTAAHAGPTALLRIPTAEVLPDGGAYINVASPVYSGGAITGASTWLENQFAASDTLEYGHDFPISNPGAGVLNAKWRFDRKGRDTCALGVAGLTVAAPLNPIVYAMGQRSLGESTYLAGCDWSSPRGARAILGFRYHANQDVTWMVGHVTGPTGWSTAGARISLGRNRRWGLAVGAFSDNRGGGRGVYVNLGRAF